MTAYDLIDGAFLTLYGAGCAILLYLLMAKTTYTGTAQRVIR